MSEEIKKDLSRRAALGRLSALALGAYAVPSFTTLSIANASDDSDSSGSSGSDDTSSASEPSEPSEPSVSEPSEPSEPSVSEPSCSSNLDDGCTPTQPVAPKTQ